jgi:hypothetical protein
VVEENKMSASDGLSMEEKIKCLAILKNKSYEFISDVTAHDVNYLGIMFRSHPGVADKEFDIVDIVEATVESQRMRAHMVNSYVGDVAAFREKIGKLDPADVPAEYHSMLKLLQ